MTSKALLNSQRIFIITLLILLLSDCCDCVDLQVRPQFDCRMPEVQRANKCFISSIICYQLHLLEDMMQCRVSDLVIMSSGADTPNHPAPRRVALAAICETELPEVVREADQDGRTETSVLTNTPLRFLASVSLLDRGGKGHVRGLGFIKYASEPFAHILSFIFKLSLWTLNSKLGSLENHFENLLLSNLSVLSVHASYPCCLGEDFPWRSPGLWPVEEMWVAEVQSSSVWLSGFGCREEEKAATFEAYWAQL